MPWPPGPSATPGGALELEAHPRSYLREGLVNLRANAHYLPGRDGEVTGACRRGGS